MTHGAASGPPERARRGFRVSGSGPRLPAPAALPGRGIRRPGADHHGPPAAGAGHRSPARERSPGRWPAGWTRLTRWRCRRRWWRRGRRRPGGNHPALRWITGAAESAPLGGPYALVTAGASLHWMSWRPTLTRLATAVTDHAYLAIVDHGYRDLPWQAELTEIIVRHSRSPGYDPAFSLTGALQAEGLLEIAGRAATTPTRFRQPVADYVQALPLDFQPGPGADDRRGGRCLRPGRHRPGAAPRRGRPARPAGRGRPGLGSITVTAGG